jgi:2-iminoacetate synthase
MTTLPQMNSALSRDATDFIDDAYIEGLIGQRTDAARVRDVLAKSRSKEPLTVEESAVLINADDPELTEEMFETARQLKQDVYGNRIVLFAPLYIGNECVNDCQYCGFRRSQQGAVRRTLDDSELREQVRALEEQGHKRLILVFGEHPMYDAGVHRRDGGRCTRRSRARARPGG